jgi:SAM-dependent methyltransferase
MKKNIEPGFDSDQSLQAKQYIFPYHFIPVPGKRPRLARFWRFSASYVAALELVSEEMLEFKSRASSTGPLKYIDIGCGDGALVHFLSSQKCFDEVRMLGIDSDNNALDWARMFNSAGKFRCLPIEEIKGSFDIVTLIEVLEHIEPPALSNFLDSVGNVLATNGVLIITVPSVGKEVPDKHFQHFSIETLTTILEPSFKIGRIFGFECIDSWYKFLSKCLWNSQWRIDVPLLNRYLIDRHKKSRNSDRFSGRLFCIAYKK